MILLDHADATTRATYLRGQVFHRNGKRPRTIDTSSLLTTFGAPAAFKDTVGEAEAMAADEARCSPPSPPGRSFGNNQKDSSMSSSQRLTERAKTSKINRLSVGSFDLSVGCSREEETFSTPTIIGEVASGVVVGRGNSTTAAPAYEPPPSGKQPWARPFALTSTQRQDTETQPQAGPREKDELGGGNVKNEGVGAHEKNGSRKLAPCTSPTASRQEEQTVSSAKNDGQDRGVQVLVLSPEGLRPVPGFARESFLATMSRSNDAYRRVREDLVQYMKGVRAK